MSVLREWPAFYQERLRWLDNPPVQSISPASSGEFVLYWMHHAVRDHENPALDVAILAANALSLPLLVYQGLGGAHRYNSDRHHTFILEGIRDVQRAFRRKGVSYAVSVPSPAQTMAQSSSGLLSLATRAAVVVTEDFPVPPFVQWKASLATKIRAPVLLVDCACIVPMQSVARAHTRAFEFRQATRVAFSDRLGVAYPSSDIVVREFSGELGFESADLSRMDIADFCASLDIDHSVGAAPDTVGGSDAGYRRWQAFVANGLDDYAQRRNDAAAWPAGVSRLSPYLHHGQISPFRIARQTHERQSVGAEKFADELLVWRELSYNFCFHQPAQTLESVGALPQWAQSTLGAAHRGELLPVPGLEQITRARTGDQLWDACQRSLLIHGELHNNVRMTWGKSLLPWTETPAEALQTLIDLNHRFALDGNDPNSYGGLLWCLGLFDRPFKPAQPVFGTVRTRTTQAHQARLDISGYERAVRRDRDRPGSGKKAAVLGYTCAGLAAARTLNDNGLDVVLFDLNARSDTGTGCSDNALTFSVSDPRFARHVKHWQSAGMLDPVSAEGTAARIYVCSTGLSSLLAHLAGGLIVEHSASGGAVRRLEKKWVFPDSNSITTCGFDYLIVADCVEHTGHLLPQAVGELASQSEQRWLADQQLALCTHSNTEQFSQCSYLSGVAAAGRVLAADRAFILQRLQS